MLVIVMKTVMIPIVKFLMLVIVMMTVMIPIVKSSIENLSLTPKGPWSGDKTPKNCQ